MGAFSVTIGGDRLGGTVETTATVQVQVIGRDFIKDPAANLVHFAHVSARQPISVSLPYTLDLYTDAASGGSDSETVAYRIRVKTAHGDGGTVEVNAKPDGAAVHFADLVSNYTGPPVPEDIAVRAEDAAAAAEAARVGAEAVGTTNDTIIAGRLNTPGSATRAAAGALYVAPKGKTTNGPAAPLPDINLRDYGAVGDGVANDTAAVQAAVTAASGGVLFVPAGQYLLTAPINLPGTITIRGESAKGSNRSRFTTTHSGYAFVTPAASNFRVEVKNLWVTCVNGFDLRSTTRTEIGLASFDQVAFSGGDGTGIAINCLNHDFSKITNCGFFFNGLCGIRLSGWYGTGGNKAITAMEVAHNYFGSPLQIGVSADIFESIYCQQNDFGSVQYPADIGGARFDAAVGSSTSTNYFKRGESKPVENYFGVGTNFYFRDNHLENTVISVMAYGKSHALKSLHVVGNNDFVRSGTARFARISGVMASTFAENEIDYDIYTTSEGFVYSGSTGLEFRDNRHFTRVFDGASNPNTYVDSGSNFYVDIQGRMVGSAYNQPARTIRGVGSLPARASVRHQAVSASTTLAQNAETVLATYAGRLAGTVYIECGVSGVGTSASVWAVFEGGATRISGEANTGSLYSVTVDSASKQIRLRGLVAGSNTYAAAGFLAGLV